MDSSAQESRTAMNGASGFYTTRQADDEYKIRGCQDEVDKDDDKDEEENADAGVEQKKKKRKKRKKNKNKQMANADGAVAEIDAQELNQN